MSIRVLVADDHEVVRCGLVNLVTGTDIEVIGEATSGEEAVRLSAELKPDVIIIALVVLEVVLEIA